MSFIVPEEAMFTTYAEVDNASKKRLREYMKYIDDNNLNELILKDPKYAPTDFWKGICKNTFIGFSSSRVSIESGFEFASSSYTSRVRQDTSPIRRLWHHFLLHKDAAKQYRNANYHSVRREYLRLYDESSLRKNEETLAKLKPTTFFHYKENQNLAGGKPNNILEIGAGCGVSAAIERLGNPECRYVIIDLPEVIAIAFVFLRTVFPDFVVTLPNELNENSDIQFLTPLQVDALEPNSFDRVTNMSSFAEMPNIVVNNYIQLAHNVLKTGSSLVSSNQKTSRHISGNSLVNYDFSAFEKVSEKTPELWQQGTKKYGVEVVLVNAIK